MRDIEPTETISEILRSSRWLARDDRSHLHRSYLQYHQIRSSIVPWNPRTGLWSRTDIQTDFSCFINPYRTRQDPESRAPQFCKGPLLAGFADLTAIVAEQQGASFHWRTAFAHVYSIRVDASSMIVETCPLLELWFGQHTLSTQSSDTTKVPIAGKGMTL